MENHLYSAQNAKRRRMIGMCAAFLAWCVALIEFGAPLIFWTLDYPKAVADYVNTYSDIMPSLLSPEYRLSDLAMSLVLTLEMVPIGLTVSALVLTGLFFMNLSKGKIWTESNIKMVCWAGLLFIAAPILSSIVYTLQSLALSIDLAPSERALSIKIGSSSRAAHSILQGIFLCALSLLMTDSKAIDDENRGYL